MPEAAELAQKAFPVPIQLSQARWHSPFKGAVLGTLKQMTWCREGWIFFQAELAKPLPCSFQEDVQTEKQKVESEFNHIHEFLEKIERFLIIMLKKFDKEIVQRRDGAATKLSEEIARLDTLITEVEEKCQQSASEFLQVRLS